jgi:hypothetical protein
VWGRTYSADRPGSHTRRLRARTRIQRGSATTAWAVAKFEGVRHVVSFPSSCRRHARCARCRNDRRRWAGGHDAGSAGRCRGSAGRTDSEERALRKPAWAAAQARTTGRPTVADTLTTATSQTVANPDGTTTVATSAQPVRVKHGTVWVALDPTLVRNADGTCQPAATTTKLTLSSGGNGPMVTMSEPRGKSLSLSWPAGKLPSPTVSGDTATYPSVLPGVDLVLRATNQAGSPRYSWSITPRPHQPRVGQPEPRPADHRGDRARRRRR